MKNKAKLWRRIPKISADGEKKLHRQGAGVLWSTAGKVREDSLIFRVFKRAGIVLI